MSGNNLKLEKATNLLRETIPRMSKLGIPITPKNYHTWYEYTVGTSNALTQDIDSLLAKDEKFTNKINNELYSTHIYQPPEKALSSYQNDVQKLVTTLFEKLNGITQTTRSFSSSLEKYSDALGTEPDLDSVTKLISGLLDDTGSVIKANDSMAVMLDSMNSEVETLHTNLQTLNIEAYTDQLTGIPNRRAFDKTIDELFDDYQDSGRKFTVLLVDIDHFKVFNDTHGHAVGDKVLKFVAKVMKGAVKGDDMLARYGGEEFIFLLPDIDYEIAIEIGNRVREKVANVNLVDNEQGKSLGNVTISIGVAQVTERDDDDSIVKRADDCLYMAKDKGRNQVVGEQELD